jgi:ABC-type multidrug transport system fused ATPase/permease subunit
MRRLFYINVGPAQVVTFGPLLTSLVIELLEAVLFANIRFHDTVSRGRLLNRFGKDFEGLFSETTLFFSSIMTHDNIGIDSRLADNFGRSLIFALSFFVTVVSVTLAGGVPFLIAIVILGFIYYDGLQHFS